MTYQILHGSNLDILPTLPDNSVDAIVTDPPYELGFMGKKWDSSGIAYNVELWRECLRVLKPGGHLLAFSGSRTYHRMVVAIEDSGFEIRDMISWISNKTFPKSHNIEKATESEDWKGWGTALKPTVEPIVMARKPLIGTIAENVLTYGTGGLNIDGSRIAAIDQKELEKNWDRNQSIAAQEGGNSMTGGLNTIDLSGYKAQGRWPANVILDPYTAELLDQQSGISKSPKTYVRKSGTLEGERVAYANIGEAAGTASQNYGDTGGASRFFYVAKASKRDRNEGLEELPNSKVGAFNGNVLQADGNKIGANPEKPNKAGKNFHPTVKPTDLMRYLVKLVTPPGGTVLDPFTGSGSTGKAAILEGFDFIGIELTNEYLPIIEGRLAHAEKQAEEERQKKDEALF